MCVPRGRLHADRNRHAAAAARRRIRYVDDDHHETCWTVLRAAARGEPRARSTFARSYAPTIRGYLEARWRGRLLSTETDDAIQEVFVECIKDGGVLERADSARGDFRGLLFGAVRNVARRYEERFLKDKRAGPEDSAWIQHLASDEAGQSTVFDRAWARTLLHQAKDLHRQRALSDGEAGCRRIELLERRFGGNEAIREIAASWGVPAQEVHNSFRKARTEFYRCLREVVGSHASVGCDLDRECRRLLGLLR